MASNVMASNSEGLSPPEASARGGGGGRLLLTEVLDSLEIRVGSSLAPRDRGNRHWHNLANSTRLPSLAFLT
jgi:hypothetical protein